MMDLSIHFCNQQTECISSNVISFGDQNYGRKKLGKQTQCWLPLSSISVLFPQCPNKIRLFCAELKILTA